MKEQISLKDISVVIPTYNRSKDLRLMLKYLMPFSKQLNEIIIVDQSEDDETRDLVKKHKSLKYVYSKIPSITIARNLGVKKSSKKSKFISFLDDDVLVGKNYFKEILKVFSSYPQAKGVAGFNNSKEGSRTSFFERWLCGLFFLSRLENNNARIVSSYGNTYPFPGLNKVIESQWFPGVNMVYRREVFDEQKFDENLLGYAVVEDLDFSHGLYRRHPGSLFITPFASVKHRHLSVGRYPVKRLSYINQVDHFYFHIKHLRKSFGQRVIFAWSLFGILLLRTFRYLFGFKKENFLKLKFFCSSLFYCLTHFKQIKKGKLRGFSV